MLFKLRAVCHGPGGMTADLYVLLDVYNEFWFWPDWTQQPCCESITIYDDFMNVFFVMDFIWPEGNFGHVEGLKFWAAMVDQEMSIVGEYDMVSFGYQ